MHRIRKEDEQRILFELQAGLPLVSRPFARLGRGLGLSEQDVLAVAAAALSDGRARRLGAIFEPTRLGYASTLGVVTVPLSRVAEAAQTLTELPGVTHCYRRRLLAGPAGGRAWPNLWFTLQAPIRGLPAAWAEARRRLRPWRPVSLPARRRFKIRAVFGDPAVPGRQVAPPAEHQARDWPAQRLSAAAWRAVGALQGSLPIKPRPYAAAAADCGLSEQAMLALLRRWRREGVLRRVALVVRHQRLGFGANALAVWDAPSQAVAGAGRILARRSDVSHCYERWPAPGLPGNLFAMFHAGATPALLAAFRQAERQAGLSDGVLLASVREYKKTSLRYSQRNEGTRP
jgi:DNA-binding Lrp family transcriptional regulator